MDLSYREHLEKEIRRCEVKLATITDPDRHSIALSYINKLKRAKRRGIPKGMDNSTTLTGVGRGRMIYIPTLPVQP